VPELVGVENSADHLDLTTECLEHPRVEDLAVAARKIAPGWPFTSCGHGAYSASVATWRIDRSLGRAFSGVVVMVVMADSSRLT
jgi:hypothetical protein